MKEKYMREAIKEMNKAINIEETPVGAVIVFEDKIIGRGYNKKENMKDPTYHAEIIAIKKACKRINDWRLNKCSIYITMEPCAMCMGAIVESRIKNVYCGLENKKSHNINKNIAKNEKITIENGILYKEIDTKLKSFFKSIRNR